MDGFAHGEEGCGFGKSVGRAFLDATLSSFNPT